MCVRSYWRSGKDTEPYIHTLVHVFSSLSAYHILIKPEAKTVLVNPTRMSHRVFLDT